MSKFLITFLFISISTSCGQDSHQLDAEQLQRMVEIRGRIKIEMGANYDLPVVPATNEQLKRGAELYALVCASCHGVRGRGNGITVQEGLLVRPADFTDSEQATFYSDQGRIYNIKKGVPGTPMMGWENVLTQEDILSVFLYIRSLIYEK